MQVQHQRYIANGTTMSRPPLPVYARRLISSASQESRLELSEPVFMLQLIRYTPGTVF